MNQLEDKATGALAGAAVADALGGAAEGNTPEAIQQRYDGYITGIVAPYYPDWRDARPISPYHKGDGHITDDTLMTNVIVRVYDEVRDHLDAYSVAEHLVPKLIDHKQWIPEFETEALLLQRLFLAEKWLVLRLHNGHADPRSAGVGNIVNCGATMYMGPVGIANAAAPASAYAEAVNIASAHQSSYGQEAAAVYAAAVAQAMTPGATLADVVDTALACAKDGTRTAIENLVNTAAPFDGWRDHLADLRTAVRPWDTVGDNYRAPALDARIPSRTKAIEELPIALGLLVACQGDYTESVLGAVNYGRDSDSIAVMAGTIAGALGGRSVVPDEWVDAVGTASRLDLESSGTTMAAVARDIFLKDERRGLQRAAAMARLSDPREVAVPA